jgi:hypothetical protein
MRLLPKSFVGPPITEAPHDIYVCFLFLPVLLVQLDMKLYLILFMLVKSDMWICNAAISEYAYNRNHTDPVSMQKAVSGESGVEEL